MITNYNKVRCPTFQCRAITGDDNLSAEMVKDMIKGWQHWILVMTPAIIDNYFNTSRDASISDFTLIIFDEMHHTKKKHYYNSVINKYWQAVDENEHCLPQVRWFTLFSCRKAPNHLFKILDSPYTFCGNPAVQLHTSYEEVGLVLIIITAGIYTRLNSNITT